MDRLKNLVPQSIKNLYHLGIAAFGLARFGHPARSLTVIGVTGTDGKTTTATLAYHLLQNAGYKVALISTVAAYIGKKQIDTGFHVTSPDPIELQKLLRLIKSKGFTHVVLEATSHGLDQHRLHGTNITLGILTNITHEHLDYHPTFQHYQKSKAKLFTHAKVAFLNQDDQSFAPIKALLPSTTRLIPYSRKSKSPYHETIKKTFPQTYNQSNALAVATLGEYLGISTDIIKSTLSNPVTIPGRLESIPNSRGLHLIVDFAHTPNALTQVLSETKKHATGKLIAVFGSAGLRDATKRPLMGQAAASFADEIVLTAEDPRSENVFTIIRQIKEGIATNHGHVHALSDRGEAINFAINTLSSPGDTVIVLGKGHERSMNLDGKKEIPWSDQAVVNQAAKGIWPN